MMIAAREALQQYGATKPKLIAVTVLTSMEQSDLTELGISLSPAQQVEKLAALVSQSGLDGVVCSAQEAVALKQKFGNNFQLVTPGIRPATSNPDDQKRIMTPAAAVQAGVDYLVIGRPITQAISPGNALQAIVTEIAGATAS